MSEDRAPYDSKSVAKAAGVADQEREAAGNERRIQKAMDREEARLEVIKLDMLPKGYWGAEWRKTYRRLVILAEAAMAHLDDTAAEQATREEYCGKALASHLERVGTCLACMQRILE